MNTGHPEAEMIFQPILQGVAESYVIASDLDDATLRNALAALSVFRGPGQLARSVATAIISDELASRDERRLQCIRARLDYARDCARCNRDQNISLDMDPFEIETLIEALGRLDTTGTPAPAILQKKTRPRLARGRAVNHHRADDVKLYHRRANRATVRQSKCRN